MADPETLTRRCTMSKKKKWYDGCPELVADSGKCKIKVPTRYNDYCDEHDCPRSNAKKVVAGLIHNRGPFAGKDKGCRCCG